MAYARAFPAYCFIQLMFLLLLRADISRTRMLASRLEVREKSELQVSLLRGSNIQENHQTSASDATTIFEMLF